MDYKEIRHRYYKLGKGREEILIRMGYLKPEVRGPEPPDQKMEKIMLMAIEYDGRIEELVRLIEEKEAELAADNP